jgi:anti-sigma regulatory factor (Ser/Thr protein kinase)
MRKSIRRGSTPDVIELRLPLKPRYFTIFRATMGAVAGVASSNYDEIMQLRVAVSEVFDLALKHITLGRGASGVSELAIRFSVYPDKVEIVIMGSRNYTSYLNTEEGRENLALLGSLVDELEFGSEVAGKTVIRMVKYRSITGT